MGGGQVKDGELNQLKPKHRKWTPEITGTIDRDKYNRTVIGPYDHEPLHWVKSYSGFEPRCLDTVWTVKIRASVFALYPYVFVTGPKKHDCSCRLRLRENL